MSRSHDIQGIKDYVHVSQIGHGSRVYVLYKGATIAHSASQVTVNPEGILHEISHLRCMECMSKDEFCVDSP